MSYRGLLTQTVTVVRRNAGAEDRYGNATDEWAAGVEHPARLTQVAGSEATAGRDAQISDWKLYLEADVEIDGSDRVVDEDGRTFEVVGPPTVARTPRGVHHVEARLRHIEG